MRTHVAHNADKSNIAVANGRHVDFYFRSRSSEHYVAPRKVWFKNCQNHEAACKDADRFAKSGRIPR
jgi:hypothetical protein